MMLSIEGLFVKLRVNDTQHNYIKHDDTQHKGLICVTQYEMTLSIMTLSAMMFRIEGLFVTLSIKGLFASLSITQSVSGAVLLSVTFF
jgi:hypothetical protein